MATECKTHCPNVTADYTEHTTTYLPMPIFNGKTTTITMIPQFHEIPHPEENKKWIDISKDCPGPKREVQTVSKSFAAVRRFFGKPTTEQVVVYTCPMEK